MDEYGPSTYGDAIADRYDTWFGVPSDTEDTVAFLARIAGGGPVLELGIGTGRVALPLAERGIEVRGIDASGSMVARLRAKPGGDRISVSIADFADVEVDGRFSLIFVVFNTFFALLSQDAQLRCMRGVADHLTEGGAFVLDAFVPDVARFDRGQRIGVNDVSPERVVLEASKYDPIEQRVRSSAVELTGDGARLYPVQIRFAWPSELDLMARLAGLRLRERWGGWKREQYTGEGRHVSVYERA